MRKLLLLCFLVLSSFTLLARSSKGKEFWIGFMENIDLFNFAPPFFQVHVSASAATTCTISIPKASFTATFAVNAQQVYVYTLPSGIWYPQGDEAFDGAGIRLLAQDSVEVYAFHHRQYFSESTQILPVQELGTDYIVTASDVAYVVAPTAFVVVAMQNNTTIEIDPSAKTLSNRPAYFPFTATLQAGDVYQILSINDLSGTVIKSLNPANKIAVFSGAMAATLGCNTPESGHNYEQMFPASSFGIKYHVVPFEGRHVDIVKVIGTQINTSVTVSGGPSFGLTRGQAVSFSVSAACEINANKPISVAQFATSRGCNFSAPDTTGGAGMIMLLPTNQKVNTAKFFMPTSIYYGTVLDYLPLYRVNLVINTNAIGNAKLDNVVIPANSFSAVPGNTLYSYARLSLDTLAVLHHTLSCDSGLNAMLYCFPYSNFYGHHLGFSGPDEVHYLGQNEERDMQNVKFYPSPVTTQLKVYTATAAVSCTVNDLTGRAVLKQTLDHSHEFELDLSSLLTGCYLIQITYSNQSTAVYKVIKD